MSCAALALDKRTDEPQCGCGGCAGSLQVEAVKDTNTRVEERAEERQGLAKLRQQKTELATLAASCRPDVNGYAIDYS